MEIVQSIIGAPKPRPSAGTRSRQHFSFELRAPDMAERFILSCRGECSEFDEIEGQLWPEAMVESCSGCWRYVHVEDEGLGVCVVVAGVAF